MSEGAPTPGRRTVVITGGSRGIGRAIAQRCVEAGDDVVVGARRREAVDEAVEELSKLGGGRVIGGTVDVASQESNDQFFAWVENECGTPDVCILSAGVGYWGPSGQFSPEDWRTTMRINVDGAFYGTRAVLDRMTERGSGHLVFFSSVLGKRGVPAMSAYAASKAAVATFAESVAIEAKPHGVKVTVMYPGTTATTMRDAQTERPQTPDITDPGLQLGPEDVADGVMWAINTSSRAFPTGLFLEPPGAPAR